MFLRRTKTVPWGQLARFVPAFACPKNKQNTQDLCSATGINKTWSRIMINPCINPLSPKSDWHQISPCNINAL